MRLAVAVAFAAAGCLNIPPPPDDGPDAPDEDRDGIPDDDDNCPTIAGQQPDPDGDMVGSACDLDPTMVGDIAVFETFADGLGELVANGVWAPGDGSIVAGSIDPPGDTYLIVQRSFSAVRIEIVFDVLEVLPGASNELALLSSHPVGGDEEVGDNVFLTSMPAPDFETMSIHAPWENAMQGNISFVGQGFADLAGKLTLERQPPIAMHSAYQGADPSTVDLSATMGPDAIGVLVRNARIRIDSFYAVGRP